MTIPFVIVLAFVFGSLAGGPSSSPSSAPSSGAALPPVSISAPPPNPAADAPCTKLIGALPLALPTADGPLPVRPAESTWTYVVAWGQPPVELICGVPRPAALVPGSSAQLIGINGVYWLPVQGKHETVWTTVDRAPYIQVSVPSSYAQPPLSPISTTIASTLPAVCVVSPTEADVTKLCTHRS